VQDINRQASYSLQIGRVKSDTALAADGGAMINDAVGDWRGWSCHLVNVTKVTKIARAISMGHYSAVVLSRSERNE